MYSQTIVVAALAGAATAGTHTQAYHGNNTVVTTTKVVSAYTTYCPEPTTLTFNHKVYTVTKAQTLTITDCPCTIVEPCHTCSHERPTAVPQPPTHAWHHGHDEGHYREHHDHKGHYVEEKHHGHYVEEKLHGHHVEEKHGHHVEEEHRGHKGHYAEPGKEHEYKGEHVEPGKEHEYYSKPGHEGKHEGPGYKADYKSPGYEAPGHEGKHEGPGYKAPGYEAPGHEGKHQGAAEGPGYGSKHAESPGKAVEVAGAEGRKIAYTLAVLAAGFVGYLAL